MPLPSFSDDDFLNYCVVEALMFRSAKEQEEAERRREVDEWKRKPLGTG